MTMSETLTYIKLCIVSLMHHLAEPAESGFPNWFVYLALSVITIAAYNDALTRKPDPIDCSERPITCVKSNKRWIADPRDPCNANHRRWSDCDILNY